MDVNREEFVTDLLNKSRNELVRATNTLNDESYPTEAARKQAGRKILEGVVETLKRATIITEEAEKAGKATESWVMVKWRCQANLV